MMGTFFTTFPVNASWGIIFLMGAIFLAPITWLFQRKKWRTLSYSALLLIWVLGAFIFRDRFFPGLIQVINVTIQKINSYTQYNFGTLSSDALSTADQSLNNTVFLVFLTFFLAALLSWLYNVANTRMGCFLLSVIVIALPIAMELDLTYWALLVTFFFWTLLLFVKPVEEESGVMSLPKGQFAILPLALALLLLLNLLFPMASYTRSEGIEEVRQGFLSGQLLPTPFRMGGAGSYSDGPNLAMAGNRVFTGRTVLKVKSEQPGYTEYLKSYVGNVYENNRWVSWDEELLGPQENMEEGLNGYKVQNFIGDAYKASSYSASGYTVEVENVGVNPRLIFAPYGLSDSPEEVSGMTFVEDGYLKASNELFGKSKYTLNTYPTVAGGTIPIMTTEENLTSENISELVANSNNPSAALGNVTDQALVSAISSYNSKVSAYTEVPSDLQERLTTFRSTYGISAGGSPLTTAQQVAEVLDSLCEYDLAPGVLPSGEDFVAYFLFQSHRGYCMHFASAATLILRSAGIPTRYAEGYVAYPDDYDESGWADLPDSRAHAWVEVFQEGYGWVPVEVTPAFLANTPTAEAEENEEAAETIEANPEEPDELPSSEEAPSETDQTPSDQDGEVNSSEAPLESEELSSQPEQSDSFTLPPIVKKILWIILLILLLSGILYGWRRWTVERREKSLKQSDQNRRATFIYVYSLKILHALKQKEEDYPKELYEFALRARFSESGITKENVDAMSTYLESLLQEANSTFSPAKKLFYQYVIIIL